MVKLNPLGNIFFYWQNLVMHPYKHDASNNFNGAVETHLLFTLLALS